jgi:hypothetical protein
VSTVENPQVTSKLAVWRARIPSLADVGAWFVSFVVHTALFLLLASVTLYVPLRHKIEISTAPLQIDDRPLPKEFQYSTEPQEQIGSLGTGGVDMARAAAPLQGSESAAPLGFEPTATATPVEAIHNIGTSIDVHDFNQLAAQGPNLPENVIIKGIGTAGTAAAAGAVDRITHEILLSMDERPTLVAWLFDQSGSLKPQRETIAKRFDRVYKELGVIKASGNDAFKQHGGQPLLTSIAEFGSSIKLLTPKPTDDLEEIKAAVRGIEDDPNGNGKENVFQSVGFLAEKFRHHRLASPRRNVMIVVFTDEAGDDIEALDAAVDTCRKYEMPVYVIGVPAPFGREVAYVKYVDPDPKFDQSPQKAPVHQGPESLLPERLMLLFGGTPKDEEQVDSGFGPFGLSRLAYDTGGLYFTVHPNRDADKKTEAWDTAAMSSYISKFFDERVMRNYRPDYVPVKQYYELLKTNKACAALVEASQLSATTPMENVRLRFPRADDGQFAKDLSNAQREAAKLEPKIEALTAILRQGERDREKVTTPRWQAGYDLAIGRALAVKVRTEGYNAMLAAAKQGMKFKDEKNDTWDLKSTITVSVNSALAKDADDAKKYLSRVVTDHKGTPWAMDAEKELRQPFGWEWRETFTDVQGKIAKAEARKNRPKPEKPAMPQKPRRDPPPL